MRQNLARLIAFAGLCVLAGAGRTADAQVSYLQIIACNADGTYDCKNSCFGQPCYVCCRSDCNVT